MAWPPPNPAPPLPNPAPPLPNDDPPLPKDEAPPNPELPPNPVPALPNDEADPLPKPPIDIYKFNTILIKASFHCSDINLNLLKDLSFSSLKPNAN